MIDDLCGAVARGLRAAKSSPPLFKVGVLLVRRPGTADGLEA